MRIYSILVLFILDSIFSVSSSEVFGDTKKTVDRCKGIWSSDAKALYNNDSIEGHVFSPNGKFSVSSSVDGLVFSGDKHHERHLDFLFVPPLVEVLWSPNSKYFAVNASDGGLVGTWDTKLYSVDKNSIHMIFDIDDQLRPMADKIQKCDPKEDVNFGSVSWTKDGKKVLIVMEIPPHSSCKNMGEITGFLLETSSGKLIDVISEKIIRNRLKSILGCRFSGY